jgi:hypothetical protein
MNRYHIRYNTRHGESDLVWRVFENGTEYLVQNFHIETPMCGEASVEHGVKKWNVCCEGFMTIIDNVAYIKGANK